MKINIFIVGRYIKECEKYVNPQEDTNKIESKKNENNISDNKDSTDKKITIEEKMDSSKIKNVSNENYFSLVEC